MREYSHVFYRHHRLLKYTWPQKVVAHTCRQVMLNAITLEKVWNHYTMHMQRDPENWQGLKHFRQCVESETVEHRIKYLCYGVLEHAANLRDQARTPAHQHVDGVPHVDVVPDFQPPKRNVAKLWFSRQDLRDIRRNPRLNHSLVKIPEGQRPSCKMCFFQKRPRAHTRWMCSVCQVALCGFGTRSCFEEFHSAEL